MKNYIFKLSFFKKIDFLLFNFKKEYIYLFFLSLINGFLELFSIGLIIPVVISFTNSVSNFGNNIIINQFINY